MSEVLNDNKKINKKKILAIVISAIAFVSVFVGTFLMRGFLEDYYRNKKISAMIDAYSSINEASNKGTFASDEFGRAFQNICEKNNVNIIIIDSRTQTLKASSRDFEEMSKNLIDYIFNKSSMYNDNLLDSSGKYEIHSVTVPGSNSEYLDMWGVLDNGNIFLIRSPMEGIRESVRIANRFFTYIFLVVLFVGILLLAIQWRRVSINELKLKNEQLKHDIEQKERIENMRSEFLSNISHELKTPIALIQGYAEGLTESVNDDEESKNFYCEVIMDEASKMNNIVKKLMDIDQLEFGDANITNEVFDIVEMIKGYLQASSILISQKHVNVKFNVDEKIYVCTDADYAREVFDNYFTNALNHVEDRMDICIDIEKNGTCVIISIFNSGNPIPEESISRLWDKFYKVDKARTREYGGSGVGLSIVKAIQESIGQQYGVENYSDGVKFYYSLKSVDDSLES
ncbi:MAG: ATP-binding protein [Lachnospiraceae bacterium]|nr:ATP-binding protein [Lachnospiraceae bacterium]